MKSAILASILAATAVTAQTGDWGRATQMGSMMYGGTTWHMLLATLFWVGLVLLVWLWVFKLWKEIKRMK